MQTDLIATASPKRSAIVSWRPPAALRRLRAKAAAESLATIRALAQDDRLPAEVRRMAEYIAEYLFDPELDFAGILASARRRDLDAGTIAEGFATHVGDPPMRFVERHRYRVAVALLSQAELSAADAVTLAGFASFTAFGRAASWVSTQDDRIAEHRRAARGARADLDAILDRLADELSGPDLHGLAARLLERLALARERVTSPR